MVNASLNWASIVGIVLAVCGGGLYFLRSFKPALARDYDVFFAAIGLLCGGILFFQGWRLDPILQFGQFLLAGTTVFFAYESVRLRGVATDQARRSSFFEDDEIPNMPRNASRNRWDEDYDRFEQTSNPRRRFQSREVDIDEEDYQEDNYRDRRSSRAIPPSAASRRRSSPLDDQSEDTRIRRRDRVQEDRGIDSRRNNFGDRRNIKSQLKRGSRPLANENTSRRLNDKIKDVNLKSEKKTRTINNLRTQTSTKRVEDASFIPKKDDVTRSRRKPSSVNELKTNYKNQKGRYTVSSKKDKPRDNSSRFDD